MEKGMQRRTLVKGTALALSTVIASSISGCLTKELYSDSPSYDAYTETISQIYITADEKNFVILGKKHHYIVSVAPELAKAMKSGLHARMQAEFLPIYIDENQGLQGILFLRIPEMDTLEERQLSEAEALGFRLTWPANTMTHRYEITGTRYASTKDLMAEQATTLNTTYTLQVYAIRRKNKVTRVLMTPITATTDGVLMILAIPLIPIVLLSTAPFKVK